MIGAACVGVMAAFVMTLVDALTCVPNCTSFAGHYNEPPRCLAYANGCANIGPGFLYALIWSPITAIFLGTLPGFAAVTMTPAAKRPWQSLPVLVGATLIGFCLWMTLPTLAPLTFGSGPLYLLTLFLIPSVAGFIAAVNIERIPQSMRFGAS